MLATPHNYMSSASNAFLPRIPSPLSPRSANAYSKPRHIFMSMSGHGQENADASAPDTTNNNNKEAGGRDVAFSKRAVKKAPSPNQDELKEKRRKLFLKKVADGREEKRWESRGEDMQRLDFYQRQRQWEAEQALSAPTLPFEAPDEVDEEMDELPVSSWAGSAMLLSAPATQQQNAMQQDVDEVDEVLARESEELAALLEFMQNEGDENGDGRSEHLWSDDEDYDALFSELVEKEMSGAEQQQEEMQEQGEAMDMS